MAKSNRTFFVYPTPHGPITIGAQNQGISRVLFGEHQLTGEYRPAELSNRAATELLEYFAGKRRTFDVPLAPEGTPFQQAVWRELALIAYGSAKTSTEVAKTLGRASSYRAVGSAVRNNPIDILIPAHRIVGAHGRPLGADKRACLLFALLETERRYLAQGQHRARTARNHVAPGQG